jgi:uncharacterized membrane protein
MNKQEYLAKLDAALRAAHVPDSGDILEEYAEHFDRKMQDGYGEEEVAARLTPPAEIASQFTAIGPGKEAAGIRAMILIGLSCADLLGFPTFIALYAWVAAMAALAVGSAGLGILLATGLRVGSFIPPMPYFCALLAGIAMLGLTALAAIGTEYCRLYVTQLVRVYLRWHSAALGRGASASPPLAMHPQLPIRKRRFMRDAALIALVVCAVACVGWYVSLVIATGAFEPWHALGWFQQP